jgi:hypothetical protein
MKRSLVVAVAVLFLSVACCATTITYQTFLSGPNEAPPNASPGTGYAVVTYDNTTHMLGVNVTFSGLLGTTTASHIHCCTAVPFTGTAGVATTTPTFAGFPLGVTSGTYSNVLDLTQASSWNPAFIALHTDIAGAEAYFTSHLGDGTEYLNIHTSVVPGGEIRGFLVPVPEPASMTLMAGGVLGLLTKLRKRRA